MISKHKIEELEFIRPEGYISAIARGFGLSYDDVLGHAYNDEKAMGYSEDMKSGSKFPVGYYEAVI